MRPEFKDSKLGELLGTLDEARQSLQGWHEKRTDALIALDAIRFDVEKIQAEKSAIESRLRAIESDQRMERELLQGQVAMCNEEIEKSHKEINFLNAELEKEKQLKIEAISALSEHRKNTQKFIDLEKKQSNAAIQEIRQAAEAEVTKINQVLANERETREQLEVLTKKLEKELSEIRKVMFEEAIDAIKRGKSDSNTERPKFVNEYLKRIGY